MSVLDNIKVGRHPDPQGFFTNALRLPGVAQEEGE